LPGTRSPNGLVDPETFQSVKESIDTMNGDFAEGQRAKPGGGLFLVVDAVGQPFDDASFVKWDSQGSATALLPPVPYLLTQSIH
jgi:hypothetical protein